MKDGYRFKIDGSYNPATLPMERLAEYMAALSKLLGEAQSVHFSGVEKGSAVLVARVDTPARPKVQERVQSVSSGAGPKDALKAFEALDNLLMADNAVGVLADETSAVILNFPGKNRPQPQVYGPFKQDGTIDGQVYRIGGKDQTIHVHIRDGAIEHTVLVTSEDVALRLRHHLFGAPLRFRGVGTWLRQGDGTWILNGFKIEDFEELDDAPLNDVVERIRKVKGSKWNEVPDPVRYLLEGRNGNGEAH